MEDQEIRQVFRVREAMSVRMGSPILEENPQFSQLLLTLGNHITPDGISRQVDADLTQAKQQLSRAKEQWLQQHVLYEELSNLTMSYEKKDGEEELSAEDEEVRSLLQDSLTYAEVGDYLEVSGDSSTGSALLGLSRQDLEERNPYRQHIPTLLQRFLPELEGGLRQKCEQIVTAYYTPHHTGDQKLQLAKASQLPGLLETEAQHLENNKKQLKMDNLKMHKQLWRYFEALMDSIAVLENLLVNHRLKIQVERDDITSTWLTAKCDAMCLKIKLFEMELLSTTYTSNTIKAHKTIRKYLNQKDEAIQKELMQVSQTLQTYESIGVEFSALVNEYSRLLNELESKRWALNQVGRAHQESKH
ncbi:HAUS augmin-like complex subunit 4 [Liolophura sinensis]|uniref:HAUS augmin-like complex subunit 4 n=1 Tax=Liolophura sinensis TaxID=3198878 RepID=UPI0031588D67